MMLWSILIAAIPSRYHSVQPLLFSLLEKQSVNRMPDVQYLYLMDNKRMTVGEKRNHLLNMAVGEYVTFIDDDDDIAPNYVSKIHDAIIEARKSKMPIDVICFPQRATLHPHNVTHECTYSLAHWRNREPYKRRVLAPCLGEDGKPLPNVLNWTGPPAHTMAWRRDLLLDVKFPDKNFGEDVDFIDAACGKAVTEICLNGGPLYYYKFSEQGHAV